MKSVRHEYETQHYKECLADTEAALKTYSLTPGARAWFTETEALCREDLKDVKGSDQLYKDIIDYVPNTSFADEAKRRLAREDGDQKDHFEINLVDEHWRRAGKEWSAEFVKTAYVPEGKTPQTTDRMIFSSAVRRGSNITSAADLVDRCTASMELSGNDLKTMPIGTVTTNEGLWDMHGVVNHTKSAGLIRIAAGPERICMIVFIKDRTDALTPEEHAYWLAKLKEAKIVSGD